MHKTKSLPVGVKSQLQKKNYLGFDLITTYISFKEDA